MLPGGTAASAGRQNVVSEVPFELNWALLHAPSQMRIRQSSSHDAPARLPLVVRLNPIDP